MHADNSTHLIAAAQRRHEDARQRAVHAILTAQSKGHRLSVSALATTAGVSRSFLYANPDLLAALAALRPGLPDRHPTTGTSATHKSLISRIAALTEKNKALRTENGDLRHRREAAHGALRDQGLHGHLATAPLQHSSRAIR